VPVTGSVRGMTALYRLLIFLLALSPLSIVSAQNQDPSYQVEFVRNAADAGLSRSAGMLRVQINPPDLYGPDGEPGDPAPATLELQAAVFAGAWLADLETADSEEETFVLAKFDLFRSADTPEQYREWLDAESYASFLESIASGRIDLAADREVYALYDNIRLLGFVRYGVYTLLYTQFREAGSNTLHTSVMPVRRVNGRLLTAGSMNTNSHELYRQLVFGPLQRQITAYLERLIEN